MCTVMAINGNEVYAYISSSSTRHKVAWQDSVHPAVPRSPRALLLAPPPPRDECGGPVGPGR